VEKKIMQAKRMGFSFIQKATSTGSSVTGALVAVGSLQPVLVHFDPTSKLITFYTKRTPRRGGEQQPHQT